MPAYQGAIDRGHPGAAAQGHRQRQLFAQQAQGAGVTVEVKREPANAYFDTSLLYTKLDFAQSFWTYSSIPLWYEQSLLSDAVWNETHWRDPETDRLIREYVAA